MLSLGLSSLWMESQLFILYTSGDGLMYTPIFLVTAMLGVLPIISLLVFILKCYFAVKYRRVWAVTSYYKLYPLTMVLLLLNLLFHDVPQAILGKLLFWSPWSLFDSLFLLRAIQAAIVWFTHWKSHTAVYRCFGSLTYYSHARLVTYLITVETPNKGRFHFLRNGSCTGLFDENSVQNVTFLGLIVIY